MERLKSFLSTLGTGISIGIVLVILLIYVVDAQPKSITVGGVEFEIPTSTTEVIDPIQTLLPEKPDPTQTPKPIVVIIELPQKPDEFIRNYYSDISKEFYEETWNKLTDGYKRDHNSSGFENYAMYFSQFNEVQVISTEIVMERSDGATVLVELNYRKKNGDPDIYNLESIELIREGESWKIIDSELIKGSR